MTYTPDYVFEGEPALGTTMEVAPGVHWHRMPLPFKLDHINLWLIEDGDGWTAVDTGICKDDVKAAWQQLFDGIMGGRPLKRVIVTHFHPDHAGLAGWLCEKFDVPLVMPMLEWTFGRMLWMDSAATTLDTYRKFYRRAGFTQEMMDAVSGRLGGYGKNVAPIPAALLPIADGDKIQIGVHDWEMIVGHGHSPEHACLYCVDLDVLISGDQVLPKISPNISVWPQHPEARPLALFLDSLSRIGARVPSEPLILPSHNWPFRGLHARLADLTQHHDERLDETADAIRSPGTGVDVLKQLFTRELDQHQMFFAIGETLAHLHHLIEDGRATRTPGPDGADIFSGVG